MVSQLFQRELRQITNDTARGMFAGYVHAASEDCAACIHELVEVTGRLKPGGSLELLLSELRKISQVAIRLAWMGKDTDTDVACDADSWVRLDLRVEDVEAELLDHWKADLQVWPRMDCYASLLGCSRNLMVLGEKLVWTEGSRMAAACMRVVGAPL